MSKPNESEYHASSISIVDRPARYDPAKVDASIVGKGLIFKGEITGAGSLLIEGKVEGAINLPGSRVTIGSNGQLGADVTARDIEVSGKVRGNLSATNRVNIRAEGALRGDVAAARLNIEDGAFFKGAIDIRKPVARLMAVPSRASAETPEAPSRDDVWQQ